MIRARFYTNREDPRSVEWPIQHPYWVTGCTDQQAIVLAYASDEAEIRRLWPDATAIELEVRETYLFTDQFPKPDWFERLIERNK